MALDGGAKTFRWDDPLDLESRLSEEERMVGEAARSYAREKLLPRVVSAFADERFDREIMTEMGALGFLGATLPETYGCAGVSHVAYGLIAREIEAIDSGYRSAMSVQSSLVMYPIYAFGSEAQRRRYLPGMARGEIVGCFGLTEADGGSDPASMRTTARPTAGGFVLNGAKMWITNAPIADVALVWAKLDGVIRGFLVERGAEGFTTPKISNKLSLRASVTGEIALSDVFVPEDADAAGRPGPARPVLLPEQGPLRHRLGRDGRGRVLPARRARLRRQRARCSASRWPRASWCRRSSPTCRPRSRSASKARWRSGRLIDQGAWVPEAISLMKRNNCGKALAIAREARDMHGGNGISGEYHVMRHAANLETVNTYEGAHDVHALILGRAITGENAF